MNSNLGDRKLEAGVLLLCNLSRSGLFQLMPVKNSPLVIKRAIVDMHHMQ